MWGTDWQVSHSWIPMNESSWYSTERLWRFTYSWKPNHNYYESWRDIYYELDRALEKLEGKLDRV